MENNKVQMTNGIPICPKCQKPTERSGGGTTVTLVHYPAKFNKEGDNVNPDRNTMTLNYCCLECGHDYTIIGNATDGFKYKSTSDDSKKEGIIILVSKEGQLNLGERKEGKVRTLYSTSTGLHWGTDPVKEKPIVGEKEYDRFPDKPEGGQVYKGGDNNVDHNVCEHGERFQNLEDEHRNGC